MKADPVWPFAALVGAGGAASVAYAVTATPPNWLDRTVLTVSGAEPSGGHAMLLGVGLLMLARGLKLRRRAAHLLVMGAVLWSAAGEILTRTEPWRLLPLAAFAIALYAAHDRFNTMPDSRRLRSALHIGLGLFALVCAYGAIGLVLQRHDVEGGLSARDFGRELFFGITGNQGPLTIDGPSWFVPALAFLSGFALLVIFALILAPVRSPLPGDAFERAEIEALVRHPDSDTLAPFALRHDKAYVFSPDRRAAISFRVLLGTAVATGDPIGAADAQPEAIHEFIARCTQSGWRPAVIGARDELLPVWHGHGLRTIGIGDEVMLDVGGFTFHGRVMRNVRQAVTRTRNMGITTEVRREGDLDPELAAALLAIHDRWLKGKAEQGFSMTLDNPKSGHPEALVAIAYDRTGAPVGYQRYYAVGDNSGRPLALSLDVMPRDPGGPNGLNERLITDMVEYARDHGVPRLSLNFAAFRVMLDKGADRGPVDRAGYRLLHLLDRFILVESLYRFNAKFRPSWQPRSVGFRSWFELGWFALAALGMEFALPYDRGRAPATSTQLEGGAAPMPGVDGGAPAVH